MNSLNEWALTGLTNYSEWILPFVTYIGSLGIPFPITMVIVAVDALIHAGQLHWRLAILACLVGASLADYSEYLLGRFAQQWLKKRYGQKMAWLQAQSTINRQGDWAILLTRFWLTPLAPAINVITGAATHICASCCMINRTVLLGAALRRPGLSLCLPMGTSRPYALHLQRAVVRSILPGARCQCPGETLQEP